MNTENKAVISQTISALRFPLIVLVVAIHVTNISPVEVNGDFGKLAVLFIRNGVARIAVPLFFMISGYLILKGVTSLTAEVYATKLRKRLRTMVLPYFIWNIPIILRCLRDNLHNDLVDALLHGLGFLPLVGSCAFEPTTPDNAPLWYVRDLVFMIILMPMFYCLMKNRIVGLCVLFVGAVSLCGQWMPDTIFMSNTSVLFFCAGMYGSIHHLNLSKVCNGKQGMYWIVVSGLAFIAMLLLDVANMSASQTYPVPFHGLMILCGVCFVVLLTGKLIVLQKLKINKNLADASFFIFCIHYLVLMYALKPLNAVVAQLTGLIYLMAYLLEVALLTALCYIIYRLLYRFAPRLLSVLSGGRHAVAIGKGRD
jgi:peptidoglycan/LPS O-acetylase OafA/YrhL